MKNMLYVIGSLYDGGYRYTDAEELRVTYDLKNEELQEIVAGLKKKQKDQMDGIWEEIANSMDDRVRERICGKTESVLEFMKEYERSIPGTMEYLRTEYGVDETWMAQFDILRGKKTERLFKDERGYMVSETELRRDFESGVSELPTFEDYIRECCGKDGTLEEVTDK